MPRIITLTTDFGLSDEYAGVMKGIILSRTPETIIVDLSHSIDRQNISQAALLLQSAYRFFPAGTIHLVVVDPGVGSSRKLVLLLSDNHLFLSPDNGVLGLLLGKEKFQAAFEVQCEQFYLSPVSTTFHGRDILAPVAAELAAGLNPKDVGPAVAAQALKNLEIPSTIIDRDKGIIQGEIIYRDHFGNLLTNISETSLNDLYGEQKDTVKIKVRDTIITGILSAYADIAAGEVLAIVGSKGYLEIAVNQGSAALFLEAEVGTEITVAE